MLYFREEETKRLASFMNSTDEKALAVYGRRRTGKTELILDFVSRNEGKGIVYYQCSGYEYNVCLDDFKETICQKLPGQEVIRAFSSFKDVISYLSNISSDIKAIVIDEFPFLAKKSENAVVEFQWIIDHGLGNIKMILLGSNLSFMKHQINDYEAPLYGRFDQMIEVRPFKFSEVHKLFPDFTDAVNVYARTGGVAQYVMFFKKYASVEEATAELFFCRNGRLLQEAPNLLMQEVRDVGTYVNILRAIGSSAKDSGQISKKTGIDHRGVFSYLNKLVDLEILKVLENPLSSKKRERKFRIADNLFRFSYTFIEPNRSMITALEKKAEPFVLDERYREYLGFVYEDIIRDRCYEYALTGMLPFMPSVTGKWWGNICHNGQWLESEIDLVAFDENNLILGECKFRNKAIGINELEELKEKAGFVPSKGRKITYLLASKSGFTDELQNMDNVILINEAG